MGNFNTKLYFSFIGLLAFFLVSLNVQVYAQEKQQTEESPSHKIIIKKKIVTENGETRTIERIIDGTGNNMFFEDGEDGAVHEIEIIENGKPGEERQEIKVQRFGGDNDVFFNVTVDDTEFSAKGKGECQGPKVICIDGKGDHPGMFHLRRGMAHPGAHNLKVITLKPGDELPDDIVQQLITMGLDIEAVKKQVNAAERMVYISKIGQAPALLEVDGDEPESLKGFMLRQNTENMHFVPEMPQGLNWQSEDGNTFDFNYDFDFNFDKKDNEHAFQFEFDGEMPEMLKEKLEKHNILIDKLRDGQIRITTPDGEKTIELDVEHNDGNRHFFKLFSEGQAPGLESLKNIEDINIEIPGLEGLQNLDNLNFLKTWNWDAGPGCDDASAGKDKPFLGVLLGEPSEKGVLVDDVVEGSAAEEAGLQANDIITRINALEVGNAQELIDLIVAQKVGDQITVQYIRDGNVGTTTATLKGKAQKFEARPRGHNFEHKAPFPEPHIFRDNNWFREEVDCEKLCNSPFLGVLIENTDEGIGVHVTDIFENTGAEKAGLLEADVLVSINDLDVNDVDAVVKKILSYEPGDVVKVEFVRDGQKRKVDATLGTKANSGAYNPCDCDTGEMKKPVEHQEIIILKEQPSEDVVTTPEVLDVPSLLNETPVEQRTLQLRAFSLFPNPNSGNFTISFRAEKAEPITISVIDLSGREVYSEEVLDFNGSYYQDINISQNSGGVYFLNIIQGDKIWTERFVYSNE